VAGANRLETQLQAVMGGYMLQSMTAVNKAMQKELAGSMADMASNMEDAFSFDSAAFAEAITVNMSEEDLAELMTVMMSK
ncbi:hypothetical protein RFX30_06785, partial [Acinetobacter baumannii]|nr:hypothetical protein [Acinetobacter baumannii]